VHSAQGVTAQTTHAVLGEHTSRNLLYVALTRGRECNQAYLYERIAGETEHEHADQQPGVHVARRGTSAQAAQLARSIIASRDERARTAHDIAAQTQERAQLPDRVARFAARRAQAVAARRAAHRHWCQEVAEAALQRHQWIEQHREHSREQGIDYGLEL
jgi:hypothetical protein